VEKVEFSLAPCGPLDQLLARTGLAGSTTRLTLRAIAAALITWVPLMILVLATRKPGEQPAWYFFQDVATHVRLLLVIPLLILAEGGIGARTRMVTEHFQRSGLLTDADQPRFESILRTGHKRLNSGFAEFLIALLSYGFVGSLVMAMTRDGMLYWFEEMGPQGERLSAAGWWYAAVITLATFLFLRWTWRYIVWSWFLNRVARLDLRLATTHPDHVGGLGFVNIGHTSFTFITLAASCVVSATAANHILNEHIPLEHYQSPLIAFVVILVLLGLAPLALFAPRLVIAKRRGLIQYGHLATVYIRMFEDKWLGRTPPKEEPLLGSGDIQSLADLGGGFERLDNMRVFPFDRKTAIAFGMAAIGPMLPLLLTVMPLKEILRLLLKSLV